MAVGTFMMRGYILGMGLVGGEAPEDVEMEEVVVQEASASTKALRMRVYRRAGTDQVLPCVVCVHGSAFYGRFEGEPLLLPRTRSSVVALLEHRGSRDGGKFPNAIHDVVACVRHLRANASALGVDAERIAAFGDSSGGYLAAMLGVLTTNPRDALLGDLGKYPNESAKVNCVVALFPPTKFDVMDEQHDPMFHAQRHDDPNSPEAYFMGYPVQSKPVDHASPLSYVQHDTIPFFLAHGDADPLVPCGQSKILYDKLIDLSSAPGAHQYHEIVGAGHATKHFSDPAFATLVNDFLDKFNVPHPPAVVTPTSSASSM
ncbi:hypothetical protein CTAYLR_004516 [Chrysophaeum taylorii]|uniref:BD-FAE-like domain-containing protein n=1 Tax=Chrysophaeum taylorii TaxID=2483200 RepID=A0AAD7XRG5_9STRA|nr:hypothetical protein CTAYLR_004516 [Chrysophaeum taylorii]